MQPVKQRLPGATYFYWLVFSLAIFLASELLRMATEFQFYHVPWIDIASNYAVLGTLGTLLAGLGAMGLWGMEKVAAHWRLPTLRSLPSVIVLAAAMAVWFNLARLMLTTNGFQLPGGGGLQMASCAVGGVVGTGLLFWRSRSSLFAWMDSRRRLLQVLAWTFAATCLVLTAYLLIDPLSASPEHSLKLPPSKVKAPSVILIVLDSLTRRDMSLYGYSLTTTPNLTKIAQTWTIYENAYSTSTGTPAALPAFIMGRYPYLDDWYRYGDLAHTNATWLDLAGGLRQGGYQTYMLTAAYAPSLYHLNSSFDTVTFAHRTLVDALNTKRWSPIGSAWLYWLDEWGTEQRPHSILTETMYSYTEDFFLQQAQLGETAPFFIYLHAPRPNGAYIADEFEGTFLPIQAGLTDVNSQQPYQRVTYTPEQQPVIDRLRLRYDENILKADAEVGHLLETLRQAGLYDQALIVITSDHGTSFTGGFQGYGSYKILAAEQQIPLLVKYPYQTEGRRETAVVSNLDIMPTIMDVLGIDYSANQVDGKSLLRLNQPEARVVYTRRLLSDDTYAAVSGTLKLVYRQGEYFLFDLANDPDEQTNLYGQIQATSLYSALEQFGARIQFLQNGGDISQAPPLVFYLHP